MFFEKSKKMTVTYNYGTDYMTCSTIGDYRDHLCKDLLKQLVSTFITLP